LEIRGGLAAVSAIFAGNIYMTKHGQQGNVNIYIYIYINDFLVISVESEEN